MKLHPPPSTLRHARLDLDLLIRVVVPVLHAVVDHLRRLAVADPFPLVLSVEVHEGRELEQDAGGQRHEDGEHGAEARVVGGRGVGVEEQGSDDVSW